MNVDERQVLDGLAQEVIGAAMEVSNTLGIGFLEKVYETALVHELSLRGIAAQPQQAISVKYKGQGVGSYLADVLVDSRLLIEIKCAEAFSPEHVAQCINYLKATGLHLALLLNFKRPKLAVKRVVLNF